MVDLTQPRFSRCRILFCARARAMNGWLGSKRSGAARNTRWGHPLVDPSHPNHSAGLRWSQELIVIACALLMALCGPAYADQLLRWKLAAGESLRYQFTQSTLTETAGAGMPMKIAIDSAMTVTWKIESVDAQDVAAIIQTIDRFSVTMKTDKLDPITYDSTAKAPPIGPVREIAEAVGRIIGATCRMQMTNRGEITSVEPSEQLKHAIGSTANQSAASQAMGSMLTPEGMTQMLRQAAVILPEKPLVDGAKWEVDQETPIASGSILQRSQFTYAGVAEQDGAKRDRLSVETGFTLRPTTDKSPTPKLKEGRQTGNLWFDSTTGRFVRSELTQQLVTERPYRELTIRVRSTSNLTMKLVTGVP